MFKSLFLFLIESESTLYSSSGFVLLHNHDVKTSFHQKKMCEVLLKFLFPLRLFGMCNTKGDEAYCKYRRITTL